MNKLTIDTDYLQTKLHELLEIPSPSGYTDPIVRYACDQLADLSIDFELTRRGAIRADLPGKQKSPDRAVVTHLDTIGAMVSGLKPNGRLALTPVGTWSSRFAEGGRVTIFSDDGRHRGTVLPLKSAGHTWGDEIDTQAVSWDHVEVRVDALSDSREHLEELGFNLGDFVAFDPRPDFEPNGYINSRHLDDKAGVACVLAAARAIRDAGVALPIDCHLLFTIFEEVGSGASAILHQDVSEMVSVDNSTVSRYEKSCERGAVLAMLDQSGPYDYHLSHKLIGLADKFDIEHRRAVYRYYRSDAATAVEAGNDIRTALVCFSVDSSHGYERTHIDSLRSVSELLTVYMQSEATLERDRLELGPLNGFSEQPVEQ